MKSSITLSKKTMNRAKGAAKEHSCSVSEQIEHWIKIGRLVEDNPDLPYDVIRNILIGRSQYHELEPYN